MDGPARFMAALTMMRVARISRSSRGTMPGRAAAGASATPLGATTNLTTRAQCCYAHHLLGYLVVSMDWQLCMQVACKAVPCTQHGHEQDSELWGEADLSSRPHWSIHKGTITVSAQVLCTWSKMQQTPTMATLSE